MVIDFQVNLFSIDISANFNCPKIADYDEREGKGESDRKDDGCGR